MCFHFFIFSSLFVTKSTCCGSWALRKSVWTYSPNFVGEMIQPSGKTHLPQVAHYPCHCVWSSPAHREETRKHSRSSRGHLCCFLFFSSSSPRLSCSWPYRLHTAPPRCYANLLAACCLSAWNSELQISNKFVQLTRLFSMKKSVMHDIMNSVAPSTMFCFSGMVAMTQTGPCNLMQQQHNFDQSEHRLGPHAARALKEAQ